MSLVSELSTDGIVTVLITLCISCLMIAWLFAGRRRTSPASSLEQMRLGGREANVVTERSFAATERTTNPAPVSAEPTISAEPTFAEEPPVPADPMVLTTPRVENLTLVAPLAAAPDQSHEAVTPIKPKTEARPKPKSSQHASAISIAAALVRHDKPGMGEPLSQRPQGMKSARADGPDDLTQIRGVGARLQGILNDMGYHHFDQIAGWTGKEVTWVDQNLPGFQNRATQDQWVAQAKALVMNSGEPSERRLKSIS